MPLDYLINARSCERSLRSSPSQHHRPESVMPRLGLSQCVPAALVCGTVMIRNATQAEGPTFMKQMTDEHLAILRRHMVDVIAIYGDLASDELGKASFNERVM